MTNRNRFYIFVAIMVAAIMTALTENIIAGIVGGLVAALLLAVASYLIYWWQYRRPVLVWYELTRNNRKDRIDLEHKDSDSHIFITLETRQRIHLERIRINIVGGSNIPVITKLYDWNTGEGLESATLYENVRLRTNERNTWYWEYKTSFLRTKGNTVAIAICVRTRGAFSGELEVQSTYEERTKMPKSEKLPIHVSISRL